MRLKTILLAALPLFGCSASWAQSSVALYGAVDMFAGRVKGDITGVKASDQATTVLNSGGMSTSFFGVRGTEDLGGGYSAIFDLSAFLRADTGQAGRADAIGPPVNVAADPFWSRYSWVGLASRDLGRVRLGNVTTLLFVDTITSNAFGDSTDFSPLNLVTHIGVPQAGGTSWTNQAVYDSPVFSDVRFSLARSLSEGQGGSNSSVRIAYQQGPAAASFTWQSVRKNPSTFSDGTTSNNVKTWLIGGSYDFQVVKLYAHVGEIRNNGTETAPQDVAYRLAEISASVPVGQGNILAGYALRKTSDTPSPVPSAVAGGNIKRAILTVGYDHNLSKRTDLYAILMNDRTETLTLPAPPTDVHASGTSVGLGIRHRF